MRVELWIAPIFLVMLCFWDFPDIEKVLIEVTVLVLVTKHLIEIVVKND